MVLLKTQGAAGKIQPFPLKLLRAEAAKCFAEDASHFLNLLLLHYSKKIIFIFSFSSPNTQLE